MFTHDAELAISYLSVFWGQRSMIVFFIGALRQLTSTITASFFLSNRRMGTALQRSSGKSG